MVWHLVLMTPRPDLDAANQRALIDAFERAIRGISAVRDVKIGRRITHGAAYEQLSPVSFEFMVAIGFDDLQGLQTYLNDPLHEELGARFYQSVSAGVVQDFELEGIDGLRRFSPH